MRRYFDDDKFDQFLNDFKFLFKIIKNSKGELDLKLRNNYFNLYYKGNSLAKISFKGNQYKVEMNNKFLGINKDKDDNDYVYKNDERFQLKRDKNSSYILLNPNLLRPFFQKKYLNKIYSNIKKVRYSEELTFEQLLITDNREREDLIFIDKQITEASLKRKRADLLALRQIKGNLYRFLIIEVKLGNNPELKKEVGKQLNDYIDHIKKNINNWVSSYEKTYQQIKKTGIYNEPNFDSIKIEKEVEGMVVVGGYSGIGEKYIKDLEKEFPKKNIKQFKNKVEF